MTASEAVDRLNTVRKLLLRVERSERMSKLDGDAIRSGKKGVTEGRNVSRYPKTRATRLALNGMPGKVNRCLPAVRRLHDGPQRDHSDHQAPTDPSSPKPVWLAGTDR